MAVAGTVAFKGRLVADRSMELLDASRWLRGAMRIHCYGIPAMIVYPFSDGIVAISNLVLPH